MKRIIAFCPVLLWCVVLITGCAHLTPDAEQAAAANNRPWTGGSAPATDYPLADLTASILRGVSGSK